MNLCPCACVLELEYRVLVLAFTDILLVAAFMHPDVWWQIIVSRVVWDALACHKTRQMNRPTYTVVCQDTT